VTTTELVAIFEEDIVLDDERKHVKEQVTYFVAEDDETTLLS
jgi:hypothetical protein